MKLINDYEDYRTKLSLLKKNADEKQKKVYSNCYFLPNKIKELIKHQKLFIEEIDENIYVLTQEDGFLRLYYFVWNTEAVKPITFTLPTVIEYTYKGSITEKQETEIDIIKSLGFTLGRKSGRMVLKTQDIVISEPIQDNEIELGFAVKEDKEKIIELLHSAFVPMYAFLPNDAELDELLSSKGILSLRYKGKLAGILNIELVKKNAWVRQLVIYNEFRRRGYGKLLMSTYHAMMKDKADNFMLWVDRANPVISIYTKLGYKFDGCMANEYISEISCYHHSF